MDQMTRISREDINEEGKREGGQGDRWCPLQGNNDDGVARIRCDTERTRGPVRLAAEDWRWVPDGYSRL